MVMTVTWEQVRPVMAELGIAGARSKRLSTQSQAGVFRIWQGDQDSVILKVTERKATVAREVAVDKLLVAHGPVPFARVLTHGESGELGWIVYEDWLLQDVVWTDALDRQIAGLAARIHRLDATWPRETGDTHTPGFGTVLDELSEEGLDAVHRALLEVLPANEAPGANVITALWQIVFDRRSLVDHVPEVFCHGDLHRGNVMRRSALGGLYVIDWEFAHVDSPLYDLFQWLDATSPHTPLTCCLSRVRAVETYYEAARDRLSGASRPEFIAAYHLFASSYLMWIALRVSADHRANRFQVSTLRRQQRENAQALGQIAQDLSQMGVSP